MPGAECTKGALPKKKSAREERADANRRDLLQRSDLRISQRKVPPFPVTYPTTQGSSIASRVVRGGEAGQRTTEGG